METVKLQKTIDGRLLTLIYIHRRICIYYVRVKKIQFYLFLVLFYFLDWPTRRLCESGWALWFSWQVQNFSRGPGLFSSHQLQVGGCCSQAQRVLPRRHRRLFWQRRRRHQRYRDLPGAAAGSVLAPFVLCSRLLPRSAKLDAHVGFESHIISEQVLQLERADPCKSFSYSQMNDRGHVILCGQISQYNKDVPYPPPLNEETLEVLQKKNITRERFLLLSYMDKAEAALCELSQWVRSGQIKVRSKHLMHGGLLILPWMHWNLSFPATGTGNCGEWHREYGR